MNTNTVKETRTELHRTAAVINNAKTEAAKAQIKELMETASPEQKRKMLQQLLKALS